MNGKLIRRMIENGYCDEDIDGRLRCGTEIVAAIREQIRMKEERKKSYKEEDYDWGE